MEWSMVRFGVLAIARSQISVLLTLFKVLRAAELKRMKILPAHVYTKTTVALQSVSVRTRIQCALKPASKV